MQAVDLNLATRPFKNDTLPWLGLAVGIGLLGYVSWWNVTTWLEHRELLAKLHESESSISARFDELDRRDRTALREIDGFELPVISVRATKANEVIRWKAFSWTRLFNRLQDVMPYDVQMTSVHPVFRGDTRRSEDAVEDIDRVPVSVEGVAKTLEDLFEFQRNLIRDPHFQRPEPDSWGTDDNSRETVFRIRFLYDPRGAEEPVEDEAQIVSAEGTAGDADAAAEQAGAAEPALTVEAEPPAPAADTADAVVAEEEPTGALASDELKKIDRTGKRGKKNRPGTDAVEEQR